MTGEQARHAQRIVEWRESLATMGDAQFFELIRMYLGELKSPFNKQNLIEELSSFLRKPDNKRKIAELLSESDIEVVSAVKFISEATPRKIADFFCGKFTFSKLYERILNLEERLVLYKHGDFLFVNPHLDETLSTIATKSVLAWESCVEKENTKEGFRLSPELLLAFAAFVSENGDICKADGSFKKRAAADIEARFQCGQAPIKRLKDAFENMSILVTNSSGSLSVDMPRLRSFAHLPEALQYAYIAVSSLGRFSRRMLVQQAKLLIEVLLSVRTGFTKENMIRTMYLATENTRRDGGEEAFGATGRFASILQRARKTEAEAESDGQKENAFDEMKRTGCVFSSFERLFDSALELGLLRIRGIDCDKNDIFAPISGIGDLLAPPSGTERKVLSIDAAFSAMVFPGRPLIALIDLANILELRKFDTAVSFEITKKSVTRAFNAGMTEEKISEVLSDACLHELPQNIAVSLDDWRNSFSSVSLFRGYVLRVSEEKIPLVTKNPALAPLIAETLAPGIFLINAESDAQAARLIAESGLDFIGKVRTAEKSDGAAEFPVFRARMIEGCGEKKCGNITSVEERKAHFDKMREILDSMDITKEERECLLFRINRKIVLDESQLKAESVKFAKIEAGGMDFTGKVHIIEQAVTDKCPIEITFASEESSGVESVSGIPSGTEKSDDDVRVSMRISGSDDIRTFSISQATKVRRIYDTAFRR